MEENILETHREPKRLLLTAEQVAQMLSFDIDHGDPVAAVKYLHRTRQLPAVKLSGRLRWKSEDVERFAQRLQNR